MSRLPLGDLESALKDPKAYRKKIDTPRSPGFGQSYFGYLRIALLKYHNSKDIVDARRYLEERLDRFKSAYRQSETLEQFDWYIDEYSRRGWPTFGTRLRIQVSLPNWVPADLRCSGEIPRIDIVSGGGYATWLMKSHEPAEWEQQLQMPLIQGTVAKLLKVPTEEVRVGIYSFHERTVTSHIYTYQEIEQSHSALASLLREMGY